MRKYFEGHSVIGVAIILSVFILALCLRFYDLGTQSPWSDEIATWWYSKNLKAVFYYESHTPLFYGIVRFFLGRDLSLFSIRIFVATISVIHLIEFFFLGQLALNKRAFLVFWVLICLNPADIVFSRMARHYSWLLEGTLVYYLLWRINAPCWIKILSGTFLGLLHLFGLIPIIVLSLFDYFGSRSWKKLLVSLIPLFPVSAYYLARIIWLSFPKVLSNVSWNQMSFTSFLASLATQFLGDSYPRFEYYKVEPTFAGCVLVIIFLFVVYFHKKSFWHFAAIFAMSVFLIEVLYPWANFRVNRYLIYLPGLLSIVIAESCGDLKEKYFIPFLSLPLVWIVSFNPFLIHPWENEWVLKWYKFEEKHKIDQVIVCGTVYEKEYYHLYEDQYCWDHDIIVDQKKPLLIFMLNPAESLFAVKFINTMKITDKVNIENGGFMARFDPKDGGDL